MDHTTLTRITIETSLTHATVPHYYRMFSDMPLPRASTFIIDMSVVDKINTAGAALLIWLRATTKSQILLDNVSPMVEHMLNLLRLYPELFKPVEKNHSPAPSPRLSQNEQIDSPREDESAPCELIRIG